MDNIQQQSSDPCSSNSSANSGHSNDNNNTASNFNSSSSGPSSSSSAMEPEQQQQQQDNQEHPLTYNFTTPLSSSSSSSSPSSSSPSSHNQQQQQQQQQDSHSRPSSLQQFELPIASSSTSTLNQQNNEISEDLLTPPEPEPESGSGSIGEIAIVGGGISDVEIDEDDEEILPAINNSNDPGPDPQHQNRRHQLLNCSQGNSSSSISGGDRDSNLHNNSITDMFLNDNGCHGHVSHQHHHHHHNHHHNHHHRTINNSNNHNNHSHSQTIDRLKLLYPNVNENETPLPRSWSAHDKCHSIGLSQNNLRVNYKGAGKQHNDAASVRTANPIPPACGLYYFEVKIISKGKNGYMGIGLTSHNFKMNRLPGWDKQSYGYHGDDGNSFSSSGNGQSYGPTFTTDDIIGCGVNFVNNTCFYTKNGVHLGIAFRDLPSKLYPTVGLQTPGEEVDANFGQEQFKFDQIEDMIKQMQVETKAAIYDFPMPADQGDPTTLLHKMVSSYLVHNGYSLTADAFSRTTGTSFNEDMSSIRNRQKILKLIMSGKMSHAIEHTIRSYPGLLENNKNLLFMLKCRQFIEMVNGSDTEYCPATNNKYTIPPTLITTANSITTPNQTSVIQSTKSYQNGTQNTAVINADCVQDNHNQDIKNSFSIANNNSNESNKRNDGVISGNSDYINDVEMENGHTANGNTCKNGNSQNNSFNSNDADEDMDVDLLPSRKYCHGFERILEFGKELSQMGQQLERENKMNEEDRQMLANAFSLIAYSNPWSSPLGWQLCPSRRESVCSALNSAILESMNYQWRPPLEICVAHASELLKVMANASLGACAFVNVEDIFPQN